MNFKALDRLAIALLLIAGLNWGMIALSGYNAITDAFGPGTVYSRIIYALMGLAALYEVFAWQGMHCRICRE
jgi:uncharacterized protein